MEKSEITVVFDKIGNTLDLKINVMQKLKTVPELRFLIKEPPEIAVK